MLPEAPTRNSRLLTWVDEIAKLTQPDQIEWCDGSQQEYDRMFEITLRPVHLGHRHLGHADSKRAKVDLTNLGFHRRCTLDPRRFLPDRSTSFMLRPALNLTVRLCGTITGSSVFGF